MFDRQRTGARIRALSLASALGCAAAAAVAFGAPRSAAKPASAHKAPAPAAAPVDAVVATVDSEKIMRSEVADQVLLELLPKYLPGVLPQIKSQAAQNPTASSIGALVISRMQAHPGAPVSVTRAEIVVWIFKDKPQTLYQTI